MPMTPDEMRQLKKGDHVLVSRDAWEGCVLQPPNDLVCTVTYLNGTAYDATQVHVFPARNTDRFTAKYVFPSQVIRKLPQRGPTCSV